MEVEVKSPAKGAKVPFGAEVVKGVKLKKPEVSCFDFFFFARNACKIGLVWKTFLNNNSKL